MPAPPTEAAQGHHVERLALVVGLPTLDAAMAWRARIAALADEALPAVIARVLDRVAPDDLDLEIDNLRIDLGTIAPDAMEATVAGALETALEEQLTALVAQARLGGQPGVRATAPSASALDGFEAYLLHGTAPMPGQHFDPVRRFRALIVQPIALVAMLRRHAGDAHAIERLVLQLDDAALRSLLALLAPADAALILRYHADLHGLVRHNASAMSAPALRHATWLLSIEYLLRDAGSQFNRRSFVAHLLRGIAAGHGIAYPALLALIAQALGETRRRQPVSTSLPAVLDALIAEGSAPEARPAPRRVDSIEQRVRGAASQPAALAALVHLLGPEEFAALVHRLDPRHAALILGHLDTLGAAHRGTALMLLSDAQLSYWLRLLSLRHLLRDAGSRFNRRSWMERLLRRLAAVGGISYAALLEALAASLAQLRRNAPVAGALPTAIADLTRDLPERAMAADDPDDLAALAARLRRHRSDDAALATLAAALSPDRFTALVTHLEPNHAPARLALLAGIAEQHGAHPLGPWSGEAVARRLRHAALGALLADALPTPGAWLAALAGALTGMSGADRPRIAALLDQPHAAQIAAAPVPDPIALLPADRAAAVRADLALLRTAHAAAPLAALDGAGFAALLDTLAPIALAGAEAWDRPAFRRTLLSALAAHSGVAPRALGEWAVLARIADEAAALDGPALLAAAERFLRTGTPPADGALLVRAASVDPRGFAALLRRLVAAHSGRTDALRERMLGWMLPDEIAAALLGQGWERATACADALADAPGGTRAAAWARVLDAVLRGAALPVAPTDREPPGARYDRLALLRHWIDSGTLPAWAPPAERRKPPADAIAALSDEALAQLFADPDPRAIAPRLRRARDRLGDRGGAELLARLAPANGASAGIDAIAAVIAGVAVADDADNPAPQPPAPQGPGATGDDAALFAWLAGDATTAPDARGLRRIATLADAADAALEAALRRGLARPEARARWGAALPDAIVVRILHCIAPARARMLMDARALLTLAWRRTLPGQAHAATATVTTAIFVLIAADSVPSPRAALAALVASIAQGHPDRSAALTAQARALARQPGHAPLRAALPMPPPPSQPPPARLRAPDAGPGSRLYVANAGLVLFNPFLPRLFDQIGVLSPGPNGKPGIAGVEATSRAVHLLQFLVDERSDAPEPELVLNKLLCGLPPAAPVAPSHPLSDADRALCESLVGAVIANWPILRTTSPAGLRETFLQRQGRLERGDARWTLTVERKTVDVLVDQVPWSIGTVFHPWIPEPIYVEW